MALTIELPIEMRYALMIISRRLMMAFPKMGQIEKKNGHEVSRQY